MKLMLLVILMLLFSSVYAQDSIQLFTSSIDPTTGAISFVVVNVTEGSHTTLASFAGSGDCPPDFLGETFFYEPLSSENYVYQIDITNGNILPFDAAHEQNLHCPTVNPDGDRIAWLQYGEEAHSLVLTGVTGAEAVVVATHPAIYDMLWSPDGEILVYTATGEDETFRPLYSYQEQQTEFWARDAGLVVDYLWTPDSSTLLVAYYTQDDAVVGTLSLECVLNGSCKPDPVATFPAEAGLLLQDAFSPDGSQFIVIVETSTGMGVFESEMVMVDLESGETTPLVTNMPGLIKTSAVWIEDTIYFIGAVFDESAFALSDGAIYSITPSGGTPTIAYSAENYLPVQIFRVAPQ